MMRLLGLAKQQNLKLETLINASLRAVVGSQQQAARQPKGDPINSDDALPAEYDVDYSQVKLNRFAGKIEDLPEQGDRPPVVVVLDDEVSKIFRSSADVHKALRALSEAMPNRTDP